MAVALVFSSRVSASVRFAVVPCVRALGALRCVRAPFAMLVNLHAPITEPSHGSTPVWLLPSQP